MRIYIKKYGIWILVIMIAMLSNYSINPFLEGDLFENKKTNKSYRIQKAEVTDKKLKEVSGIAYSNSNNIFWVHNDSGNSSDIYGLGEDGKIKLIVKLDGVKNIDFEDIALTSDGKINNIYIGDIGNNNLERSEIYIYRFEEPIYKIEDFDNQVIAEISIKPEIMTIDISELDINFEAMMVENKSGKIFLIEKTKSKSSRVFYLSKFDLFQEYYAPAYYGEISFDMYGKEEVVACDISSDDRHILIKSKNNVFMLEREDLKKKVTSDKLKLMPYVEEYQGEAISWSENSLGYYTLSENDPKKPLNLYYYRNVYK